MRGGTLFSGIGAPECSAPFIDWRWAAEIEPFPSAVHAARFPGVINLGDVTKVRWEDVEPVDLVVAGSPCQSFSVAGKRLGMDDPRGNLALVALDVARRVGARWLVFENVPGLLSSFSGAEQAERAVREGPVGGTGEGVEDRDFATFLAAAAELGYFGAWRSFDAQYAGLAQRRERVFVVLHPGDWRPPAAVLLEPESLSGTPPPRREAGKNIASTLTSGAANSSGFQNGAETIDNLIAYGGPHGRIDFESETFVIKGAAINREPENGPQFGEILHDGSCYTLNATEQHAVAHTLRAEGFDASEDGTGRGIPLVPIAFSAKDHGADAGEIAPTLRAGGHDKSHANGGVMPAVAYDMRGRDGGAQFEGPHDTANIRASSGGSSRSYVAAEYAVRHLTPRECETLQGFPKAQKSYNILICRDLSDQQKSNALAALQCRKLQGNAWIAAAAGWTLSAEAAGHHSSTSLANIASPVAVDVLIDLERQEVRLHSHGRSFLPVDSVGDRSGFPLPTGIDSFAHIAVRLTRAWDLATQVGRVASPRSTTPFTTRWNGNGIAISYGRAIAGHANDVGSAIEIATRLSTSITLPPGLNTMTYDSMMETLCCCVVHAIAGYIPERTKRTSSFVVRLTTTCGWTAISYRGRPAFDGPRYKVLGNSMAVPCIGWILERIARQHGEPA